MPLAGLVKRLPINKKVSTRVQTVCKGLFVRFDSLCLSQRFLSHVEMGLPGLNQYYAEDQGSCSRTQHSYAGDA